MRKRYVDAFKHALYYLRVLNVSVIPVAPGGKEPLVKWSRYQTRRPTLEEVQNWFCERFPGANIGMVTGSVSGLVVLDVDSEEVPGFLQGVRTWIARTGRGRHFYFRVPEGVYVPCRKFEGMDLKGEGGIVILPRSVHPSGVRYEWEVPPVNKDTGKVLEPPLLTDVPELLDMISSIEEPKTPIRELYRGSPVGTRNVNMTRIVGSLALDGLDEDDALALALAVNERNEEPLEVREIQTIVKSIYKREKSARRVVKDLKNKLRKTLQESGLAKVLRELVCENLDKVEAPNAQWILKRITLVDLLADLENEGLAEGKAAVGSQ